MLLDPSSTQWPSAFEVQRSEMTSPLGDNAKVWTMPWMRRPNQRWWVDGWKGHLGRTVSCLNDGKCMKATRTCLFCWCQLLVLCLLFHSKDYFFIMTFVWSFLSGKTYDVSCICRLLIVFWWYLSIDFVYVRVLISFCFCKSMHFILLVLYWIMIMMPKLHMIFNMVWHVSHLKQ